MARRGRAQALSELVEEGWTRIPVNALEIIDLIMHENTNEFLNLDEEKKIPEHAPWR